MEQSNQPAHFANEVAAQALTQIEYMYGPNPQSPNGIDLPYHNAEHSRDVIEDFVTLSRAFDLNESLHEIGLASSAAHDVVQRGQLADDEAESAAWLEKRLKEHGVGNAMIELGVIAIRGTKPVFEAGRMVGQRISDTAGIYTPEQALPALLVACADLGKLYTPKGPLLAHRLLLELKAGTVSYDDILAFQRSQIEFLSDFRYPLEAATEVLATHRAAVMRYATQLVAKVESGEVTNLGELFESDENFIQQPSIA